MLIRRGGAIKSGEITGREVYLSRRELMVGAAALALAPAVAAAAPPAAGQPLAAARNKAYDIPDTPTKFQDATTYNNFYEFGVNKEDPSNLAGSFKPRPWKLQVDGLVQKNADTVADICASLDLDWFGETREGPPIF